MNLQDFDMAMSDFQQVLHVSPDNKAARNQITIIKQQIRNIREKEKSTFAGMFQKFAEIDAKVSKEVNANTTCNYTDMSTVVKSDHDVNDIVIMMSVYIR